MSFDDEMRNSKKSKRAAPKVEARLAGLGQAPGESGGADYAEVDFALVAGIIIETTRRGGAASFGLSRDKGAFNCTIFLDGDRRTVWIGQTQDVNGELEKILHYMASL